MDINKQLLILQNISGNIPFYDKVLDVRGAPLKACAVDIFQMNIGKICNLSCKHCHVDAGPSRTEIMGIGIMQKCLEILTDYNIPIIDITGGAPELNPNLEWFIREAAKFNRRLMVRSNLAILHDDEYSKYIDIFAVNQVEIVASLPDYIGTKTNRQRGNGVFEKIIGIMRILNGRGYGRERSGLKLNLVHNPVGAYLPGSEKALEHEYKTRLRNDHGIVFNNLFCLTNIPAGRYLEYLIQSGNYEEYINELCNNFNPTALDNAMCRNTISVSWDGTLYDCDFNQMLDLEIDHGSPSNIFEFDIAKLGRREINVHNHCYACVAGSGSSCQGCTVS